MLFFCMLFFYHFGRFVVAGMAPAGRHPDIEKFIFQTGCFCHIAEETDELAEIHVEKVACIDGARDAVFDDLGFVFVLVCFEYPVPDVQQVTEIGVHVPGIAGVVNPVMGGREDDALHKAHAAIAHNAFSHVNKSAPGAIHGHDEEEKGRVDACQYTDGSAYHIGIWRFQEEVHVSDGKVHGLGSVVSAMKTPEQSDLMTKIMIDEMSQFPDDIAIDEPVPGELGGQYGIFFKKADAKGYGGNGNKTGDEAVGHKDEERHAIVFDLKTFIGDSATDLYQQEERYHGGYGAEDPMGGGQRTVVAFLVHFQQGPESQEAKQFVV